MLDLIDIVLGVATLYLVHKLGRAAVGEILARRKLKKSRDRVREEDTLIISDVGVTMTDGGVPLKEGQKSVKKENLYISKNGKIRKNSHEPGTPPDPQD